MFGTGAIIFHQSSAIGWIAAVIVSGAALIQLFRTEDE